MPIRPSQKPLYPANWREISAAIRRRARGRCEECGVRNYAVGYREYRSGRFVPGCGNLYWDALGNGEMTYAKAVEAAREANDWQGGLGLDGERAIVIVLTVAHLDHNPANNDPANLRCLCQACHNRHDAHYRARNRRERYQMALGV